MFRWTGGARLLVLMICLGGCQQTEPVLSDVAVGLALRHQDTVLVDEELAWEFQERLDVLWKEEPALRCAGVLIDFLLDEFGVVAAPAQAEEAWNSGRIETGIDELDRLFDTYGITSVRPWAGVFDVVVGEFVNTPNLVAELEERIDGLEGHVFEGPHYDSGDVRFDETPDGWDVTLEVGWGDCHSGCIHRRTWVYALSRDLHEVELLDEYGAELSPEQRESCATRWTGS